ncbi:uncharacterized protein LOC112570423 [Pomacea canaliculata]|uniref:uncharacterized protein LOC112570423 n=1 Tax=Pomacea canaliculata TaxID=400727 RepID=UPI000D73D02E|nr:uncharacterized protein LOC112570423 [Pomacea canaliculata]
MDAALPLGVSFMSQWQRCPGRRIQERRRSQEDSESRSSESSDHSNRALQRLHTLSAAQQHHQRLMSPVAESVQPPALQDSNTASVQDANLSHLSRISIGSGNTADASSLSPPGTVKRMDIITSTPKGSLIGFPPRGKDGEERERWQTGERWQQDNQPKYAVPYHYNRQDSHLVDSESRQPVTSPQPASSRLSNPAPLHSPPVSHHMRPMMSGRELPPTPSERDQRRDTLPPERQDRLSLGGPGKDHGKYSRDERFPDLDRRKSAPPERSTTLGDEQGGEREPHALPAAYSQLLGPRGYPSSDRSSSGDGGRWSLSQGNEHNHEQPHPFYGETAKPASVARPVPQHPSIRYVSNRQQRPIPQARPASVMGNLSAPQNHEDSRHEPNDSGSTLASVRPTGVREPPRMRAEPMVMSSNGPIHRENNDNGIERPKSVPPQLFYKVDNSPSPDGYSNSANPVPVPRRSRDMAAAEASRVGHVREPAGSYHWWTARTHICSLCRDIVSIQLQHHPPESKWFAGSAPCYRDFAPVICIQWRKPA